MVHKKKCKLLACDFETTVYTGQTMTLVWSAASVPLFDSTENVTICHSIEEHFDYLLSLKSNLICYFHNLKFDGSFWLHFLLNVQKLTPALYTEKSPDGDTHKHWKSQKDMENGEFKCVISDMGQWYSITVKINNIFIDIRDSLKLLPFTLDRIGKAFKTKHRKLEMEYKGFRYPGCEITEEEKEYIANDVLVLKEALEFMFNEGHDKLTIGSCCLSEFKRGFLKEDYDSMFPDLYEIEISSVTRTSNTHDYGCKIVGDWIRKSYRGGWCYLVKGKENKVFTKGTTADVNSLYPSMMHSESGNRYPVGKPEFYSGSGNTQDDLADLNLISRTGMYYFVRIKTRFYIKDDYLPFVQVKNDLRFRANESLTSSDWIDKRTGKSYTQYWFGKSDSELELHDTSVEMTLTMTDFILLQEHYRLVNLEILDYCVFKTEIGLFDNYIDKYKRIKQTSTGAMRELAKLFLNNLYGKMASSTNSSFKIPYVKEDGVIALIDEEEYSKKAGYIPIGSAITSYARNFTIRAAQKNYHGVNSRGFIYADTDSIHCDLDPSELKGINVDDVEFCCWKLESCWDTAWFTRQKTYIEHITHENLKEISAPYYNVKCAGMPEKCKNLFVKSMENYIPREEDDFTQEELDVINSHLTIEDFKVGLTLPGKLLPKRILGGVLLVDTPYQMRAL